MTKRKLKLAKSRIITISIILALQVLILLSLIWAPSIERLIGINNPFSVASEGALFKVHFIDVGQGDATVVEFCDGKKLLFDAGHNTSEEALDKYFKEVLFKDEVWEFEFVIASHSDTDHIGNMDYVFESCQVNNVYRPKIFVDQMETAPEGAKYSSEISYKEFVSSANAEPNCNIYFIENGFSYVSSDGQYSFIFYTSFDLTAQTEDNDYSPITIINGNGKSICLTGDASSSVEKEIVLRNVLTSVDVLKAGHHGSKTSTCEQLITALNPSFAVISSGENDYGHPTDEVITRLNDAVGEGNIYRTDKNGNIIFYLDGENLNVCYGYITSADSLEWWLIVLCASLIFFSIVIWCLKPNGFTRQST